MDRFDVVIVGYGPTGAMLAGLLGQRRHRVAVLDRLPGLYPLPRAIGMDHEAMRMLQELGVADRLADHVAPWRAAEYRGTRGQPIKRVVSTPPPWRLGWAPNYAFDQPALERTLRARIAELDTVQVFVETEAVDSGQDAASAWVDARSPRWDGVRRFVAPWLVACDGGASPIRKRLGLELEDLGFDEPWLVVDALVGDERLRELPDTNIQYCEPERPCTYVVGPGRHRRWEIMLLPGDDLSPQFPETELWPLLSRWIRPGDGELWRAAAYRFHGLVARRWREGRTLLAGDAAHMTPPFFAQGMVQGLRDAANLAWKLDRILRDSSPPDLLDSYTIERRPHVMKTTLVAMDFGKVVCERDPERARARDERLIAEQGGTVRPVLRQNLIPPLEAGLVDAASPGGGQIFPQVTVRSAGFEGLLDDLTGASVRILVRRAASWPVPPALRVRIGAVEARVLLLADETVTIVDDPAGVHVVVDPSGTLAEWLDGLGAEFAVVRPDHYVYATAAGVEGLDIALERLARGVAVMSA